MLSLLTRVEEVCLQQMVTTALEESQCRSSQNILTLCDNLTLCDILTLHVISTLQDDTTL